MTYYKILQNGEVIDIIDNASWVAENSKHRIILSDADTANGIVSSTGEEIYQIAGRYLFTSGEHKTVDVVDIEKDEYDRLYTLLELGAKVIDNQTPIWYEESVSEPEPNPENETILETKKRKIQQLSETCQAVIINGVDVTLSDGVTKHFSLEIEDQINMISLSGMMENGSGMIPFHAVGELCTFYTVQDMQLIITASSRFKTYHTSYFNSLKNYVNSLETIEEIGKVQYGDTIPAEYQSQVLIAITEQMS